MKAIVYEKAKTFALKDLPRPVPGEGEVLIEVADAGGCGSDLFIYSGTHPRAKAPLVAGHEYAGTIVEVHPSLGEAFRPGMKATVRPTYACGVCHPCREGLPHVCRSLRLYGIDCDGGFAEFSKVRAENVFTLPDDADLEAAALIEPVAVAVHAVRRSELKTGDVAAVFGAGPIGCLVGLMAKKAGAREVYVSDVNGFRLEAAASLGLWPVNAKDTDFVAVLREATDGRMADVTFDCAGASQTIMAATETTRVRGQVMVVASFHAPYPIDLLAVNFKEQQFTGTRVYTDADFRVACDLVAEDPDIFKKIATVYPCTDGPAVIDSIPKGADVIKALFSFA